MATYKLATYNEDPGSDKPMGEHTYTVNLHRTGKRSNYKDQVHYSVKDEQGNVIDKGDEFYPSPLRPSAGKQAACDLIVLMGLGTPWDDESMKED